jgi:predicted transposase/invertase (TIGR01784 family)
MIAMVAMIAMIYMISMASMISTMHRSHQRNKVFYEKLTFIYIELPKFSKTADQLNSKIEKWLYLLRYLAKLQDRPYALQEKIFSKLFAAAEIAKYSKSERDQYETSLKYYRDMNNVVGTAFEDGEKKGKIETARNLKRMGFSVKQISDATGFTEEEIGNL